MINLAANRTHLQQLFTVKAFSLRAGAVVLKALTSGPLVQIDGLFLSRT
jgi:hypothetical protein